MGVSKKSGALTYMYIYIHMFVMYVCMYVFTSFCVKDRPEKHPAQLMGISISKLNTAFAPPKILAGFGYVRPSGSA